MHQDYVFDLEFSMPLHVNTYDCKSAYQSITHQLNCVVKWANQRKIFEDTSRFLDVECPYILNSTTNRMDLLFWDNFLLQGEKISLLK